MTTTSSSRGLRGGQGGAQGREGVQAAGGRVDQGAGSWYSQPGWCSSEPRWWSTVTTGWLNGWSRGSQVDGGLAAVGAYLEHRAAAGVPGGGVEQG